MGLKAANQSVLFQNSIVIISKICLISAPGDKMDNFCLRPKAKDLVITRVVVLGFFV